MTDPSPPPNSPPAGGSADASTLSQAAAAMAAAATSLTENMAKFTSLTDNISKIAQGVAGQADTQITTGDSARSFDNVYGVGNIESIRAALARFSLDYAGETLEGVKRSRNWFDKQIADVLAHDNDVRAIITQGLRNSTESDNMVSKNSVDFARATNSQTVRHADTQLFETSMGEGTEVSGTAVTDMGQAVNGLLAVAESLNAVAAQLAKVAPASTGTAAKA